MIFLRIPFSKFSSGSKLAQTYTLNYSDLHSGQDLSQIIGQAYGPKGLGILFVSNIPQYPQLRKATLPLFHKLASMPSDILDKKYGRPDIYYRIGWSKGVQKIQGKYDVTKGSYFNNCYRDVPQEIRQQQKKYYTEQQRKIHMAKNVWVDQLPELEVEVKKISKVMRQVGNMIGHQIDLFAQKHVENYEKGKIFNAMKRSQSYIGRMLHYYPYQQDNNKSNDLLCGWHNDYGLLTGLTSALYVNQYGKIVEQTIQDGLTVKNRFAQQVKIAIPANMLAYQIGEVTQIWTGGILQATPHAVCRNPQLAGKKISRNVFALFHSPHDLEIVTPPKGIDSNTIVDKEAYNVPKLKDRWTDGMLFKDLYKRDLQYYS